MKNYLLGFIQAFTAVGAIPAGIMYLIDPSGVSMGQTTALLAHSPFTSFLVPGLFLLIVNGLGSGFGAVLSFGKMRYAGEAGIILGIILILWIIIQVSMIGFIHWLQPFFFTVGLAEVILGWKVRSSFLFAK